MRLEDKLRVDWDDAVDALPGSEVDEPIEPVDEPVETGDEEPDEPSTDTSQGSTVGTVLKTGAVSLGLLGAYLGGVYNASNNGSRPVTGADTVRSQSEQVSRVPVAQDNQESNVASTNPSTNTNGSSDGRVQEDPVIERGATTGMTYRDAREVLAEDSVASILREEFSATEAYEGRDLLSERRDLYSEFNPSALIAPNSSRNVIAEQDGLFGTTEVYSETFDASEQDGKTVTPIAGKTLEEGGGEDFLFTRVSQQDTLSSLYLWDVTYNGSDDAESYEWKNKTKEKDLETGLVFSDEGYTMYSFDDDSIIASTRDASSLDRLEAEYQGIEGLRQYLSRDSLNTARDVEALQDSIQYLRDLYKGFRQRATPTLDSLNTVFSQDSSKSEIPSIKELKVTAPMSSSQTTPSRQDSVLIARMNDVPGIPSSTASDRLQIETATERLSDYLYETTTKEEPIQFGGYVNFDTQQLIDGADPDEPFAAENDLLYDDPIYAADLPEASTGPYTIQPVAGGTVPLMLNGGDDWLFLSVKKGDTMKGIYTYDVRYPGERDSSNILCGEDSSCTDSIDWRNNDDITIQPYSAIEFLNDSYSYHELSKIGVVGTYDPNRGSFYAYDELETSKENAQIRSQSIFKGYQRLTRE